MSRYDVLVVGGGPAGMTAALWARTLELSYVAVEREPLLGGQLLRVYNLVVDYPAADRADGARLAARFRRHLEELAAEVRTGSEVTSIDVATSSAVVDGAPVEARHIVLATGVRKRRLGVPGEIELAGRGVSSSATRDAPSFEGARVLVVGGGDAAFEEALILARYCEHVTIVHRSERIRARPDFRARVAESPKIDLLTNAALTAIEGASRVERAFVAIDGATRELDVKGVFVSIGVEPRSELVRGQLALDDRGYVAVDARLRSSVPTCYAAGDVRSGSSWTVAGAVGDGALAIKDIQRRLGA